MEFDGNEFRELKAGADETRLIGLNCLVRDGARLYAGTFADGLWLADGGRWLHFTTSDGLPSNRVVGIVADGERVFVATDFGLAVAQTNSLLAAQTQAVQTATQSFQTVASLPSLADIARFGGHTFLCADDGRLFTLTDNTTRGPQLNALNLGGADAPTATLTDSRLVTLDEELWLLTSDGIWRTNDNTSDATRTQARLTLAPFARTDAARELTSNTVSALAFDGAGRLWVGSFRDGIDLLAPDGRRLTHLDTAAAREVNALTVDGNTGAMLAATSQGLVRFDAALHATRTAAAEGSVEQCRHARRFAARAKQRAANVNVSFIASRTTRRACLRDGARPQSRYTRALAWADYSAGLAEQQSLCGVAARALRLRRHARRSGTN